MPGYEVVPNAYCEKRHVEDKIDNPVKILDFGESFVFDDRPRNLSQPAILKAPEVMYGDVLDYRVDLWGLGCLVSERLFVPFKRGRKKKLLTSGLSLPDH